MNAQNTETGLFVGQPVYDHDRAGWIAEIEPRNTAAGFSVSTYLVGAGMVAINYRVSIVYENGNYHDDSNEHTAADYAANGERYGVEPKDAAEVADMLRKAKAKRQAEYEAQQREREAYTAKVDAWRDTIRDKIPTDAKAVIVAEQEIDDCDTMTDYFNTKTGRVVILGFSRHTRDLFPELRKAALRFDETRDLADAPESAEHREKYSMGAGYYLKAEHRYSSGWAIRKRSFYSVRNDIAEAVPYGEWMVPEGQPYLTGTTATRKPETAPSDAETVGVFTISEHTHTKRGFQMWIVAAADRVDRETFNDWLQRAKARKGWYSRKWGSTPAGFAFKDQDEAEAFAQELSE